MACRASSRSDETTDQLWVEGRSVSRGEIFRDENHWRIKGGNTGLRQSLHDGDRAIADVAQVGDAFGEIAASCAQLSAEIVEGCPQRVGRTMPVG